MRIGVPRKGKSKYSKNKVLPPYDFPKIKIIIECIRQAFVLEAAWAGNRDDLPQAIQSTNHRVGTRSQVFLFPDLCPSPNCHHNLQVGEGALDKQEEKQSGCSLILSRSSKSLRYREELQLFWIHFFFIFFWTEFISTVSQHCAGIFQRRCNIREKIHI